MVFELQIVNNDLFLVIFSVYNSFFHAKFKQPSHFLGVIYNLSLSLKLNLKF